MRLEFRHPAIATGIHQRSLLERIMVGTVVTPVEIRDLARGDAVTAFEVEGADPDDDYEIVQYEGDLYRPAAFDITQILGGAVGFEEMHEIIDHHRIPFRPVGDALVQRIQQIVETDEAEKLLPMPRSPKVYELEQADAMLSYLSKSGPLSSSAEESEVDSWREAARRFVSHFIMVDGRTYSRTGVPLYCAGATSVQPSSTNVFRRYMDAILPSRHGGERPGLSSRLLGVMVRPTELNEARYIRRDIVKRTEQKGPMLNSPRIVSHLDVPVDDLERLDLARIAKIHLWEGRNSLNDHKKQWGDKSFEKGIGDPTSRLGIIGAAMLDMKKALDEHELKGGDIQVVETALRRLAPITMENRLFNSSDTGQKQDRCKCLNEVTKIAFERLESVPIEVPMFSSAATLPRP
ncbi:hypothetical protein HFO56_33180 [Rhizobium laguerreae]|uniref:hypothetical protein n=1 Tax=Rhizobium laguerreae TaxID=1076926 RepID=UPI001C905A57|nr:hypothetical protein [Rhizobium laguerreae]MBY3157179.1 hypothetical protein [Rhizobium laguerreae]